eukprot:2649512-Alexandrium_andersonii.AAC.1
MQRPWGLQCNGGLLELMERRARARGSEHEIYKVKGHAKAEHLASGQSTELQKRGNDCADAMAGLALKFERRHVVMLMEFCERQRA